MKKIKDYLNILHFCFYKANYRLHLLSNKINPFHLIHKIPFQKRRYEKLGIDPIEHINQMYKNKHYGMSMTIAGGILLSVLFFFFWGLINLLFGESEGLVSLTTPHIFISLLLSVAICFFFVFKKDMYIKYFDKYEKWTKVEKRKYCWLTFASVVAVFLLFYLGLKT